jgi:HEAT repeat protein
MSKNRWIVFVLTLILIPTSAALAGGKKKKKRYAPPRPTPAEATEIRKHISNIGGRRMDYQKRIESLGALGTFGAKAEMAVPQIERCLKAKREIMRLSALDALGKIAKGSRKALAVVLKVATKHKKVDMRVIAIQSLGAIGEDAVLVAPKVAKMLKDKNLRIRREAFRSISKIGLGKSRGVEKTLKSAFKDEEETPMKIEAAMALIKLGFNDIDPTKMLIEVLKKQSNIDGYRFRAAVTLGLLGDKSAAAVATLISVIGEKIDEAANPALPYGSARKLQRDKLRKVCIETLGLIGPKAKAALETLEAASAEPFLSSAANKSIKQIKG